MAQARSGRVYLIHSQLTSLLFCCSMPIVKSSTKIHYGPDCPQSGVVALLSSGQQRACFAAFLWAEAFLFLYILAVRLSIGAAMLWGLKMSTSRTAPESCFLA